MKNLTKGISPLIAGVLLVAFTIAVAGIVSTFFIDFTENRSGEVEEKGSKAIDCTFARIGFNKDDVEHNLPTSLEVTTRNAGQENLYDLEIILDVDGETFVYSPTESTKRTESNPWLPGETIVLEANITDSPSGNIETVTVTSSVCPNTAIKTVSL